MKKHIAAIVIAIFTLAGTWAAYEALLAHYGKGESGLCNIGDSFNCDTVNQSTYSEVFGIPFALLGLIGYGLIILFVIALSVRKDRKEREALLALLCALTTIGLGIQVYLTLVELLFIHIWCILCLISQASILIIAVTAWIWRARELKTTSHA